MHAERPADAYDVPLVEQVLADALELLRGDGYRLSMEHGVGGPPETSVRVETNDCEAPLTAYRVVTDFDGMPAAFATAAILSRSRTKDFNEFTVREELMAELEAAPHEDLQNVGVVELLEDHANFLGWVVESFMLRVTRRLPDGSAFGIRVPVERDDGVWTPRRYREKMRALSAWHVAGTPEGCRFTYLALERAGSIFSYMPSYVVKQLICRLVGKYILRVRRIVLQEFAADGCAGTRPKRSLLFASGSAGVPLRWGLDPAFRPASPVSPYVLHSFAPPRHGAPAASVEPAARGEETSPPSLPLPAAKTTEIFFDLAGVERRADVGPWSVDGGASWVAPPNGAHPGVESPLSRAGQVLRAEAREIQEQCNPSVLSRSAEAARASLELSLRLESMSLAGLGPALGTGLPRRAPNAGDDPHRPSRPAPHPAPSLSDDGERCGPPPPPPLVPCPKPPATSAAAAAAASSSAAAASAAAAAAVAAAAAAAAAAEEDDDAAEAASAAAASAAATAASSAAAASAAATEAAASSERGRHLWEDSDLSSGFSVYANDALPGALSTFPGASLKLIISLLRESWRAMSEDFKAGYRARLAAGEGRVISIPNPPSPAASSASPVPALRDAPPPAYAEGGPKKPVGQRPTRAQARARCCSDAALVDEGARALPPPESPLPLFRVWAPPGEPPRPMPAPVVSHDQPGPGGLYIDTGFVLHQLRAAWDSMSEEERARFVAAENSALGQRVFSLQALALAGAIPAGRGSNRRSKRKICTPPPRPLRPIVPAPAPAAPHPPTPAPGAPCSPPKPPSGPVASPAGAGTPTYTYAPTSIATGNSPPTDIQPAAGGF
eukprot:tig00000545_g1987.t1